MDDTLILLFLILNVANFENINESLTLCQLEVL